LGFRYRPRTIRYEGDPGTDFEGLWIDVLQVRTGAEFQALTQNSYWADLHEVMAPFVVGWNLEGAVADPVERDAIGTVVEARTAYELAYAPLPPPAEAGADVFSKVGPEVKAWIRAKLQESLWYRDEPDGGATRAKGKVSGNSSGDSPAGEPSATAEISAPKPRRARKSSPAPLNAT